MNDASISVIIPAYRAARTIRRAVDSILSQTLRPLEVLIVDDASPDDLALALASYGDSVRLLRKPNGGAASARNFGIERANGRFIAFLDADDYWEPTKLAQQFEVCRRHPEVGTVASRYYEEPPGCRRSEKPFPSSHPFDQVLAPTGESAFAIAARLWTGTVLVRREVLGNHRFVSGLEPAEDRDLWARLVTSAPVYFLGAPLATAVLEPGSLSRTQIERDYGNMLRVVHRHRALLGPRGIAHWERHVYQRWAGRYLGEGQPRAALGPAWQRWRRQPFSLQAWWILLKCAALSCASLRISASRASDGTTRPSV